MDRRKITGKRPLKFKDYQQFVEEMSFYPRAGYNINYTVVGLSGEAGEVSNRWKKVLRDSGGVLTTEAIVDLHMELGDALWYIAACAREMGTTLQEIARLNVAHLTQRRKESKRTGKW